jgi:DNA-directed RNA polymerase subunit RPC12/RpoP
MDPRDRPLLLPDGAACTACGASVPSGRIRVLARRDDIAFLELACPDCGSAAVAMLISTPDSDESAVLDVATDAADSRREPATGRRGASRPISAADVEAVGDDLAAWHGDLVGWLDR